MGKLPAKKKSDIGVGNSRKVAKHEAALRPDDYRRMLFGTINPAMGDALINQCFRVLKKEEASDEYPIHDERDFMVVAVWEIKPRDAVERMLAVQMAATHVALIRSARWLAHAVTIDQMKAHYSGYNKLYRTYTAPIPPKSKPCESTETAASKPSLCNM